MPNGFCGYILKPEFLRNPSSQFDPNKLTQGPWLKKKTFHVMVRLVWCFLPSTLSFLCLALRI